MDKEYTKTSALRTVFLTVATVSLLFPQFLQPYIDTIWAYLIASSFYNSSIFETIWTVVCYAAFEPFITHIFIQYPQMRIQVPTAMKYADVKSPQREAKRTHQPPGMKRPSRRLPEAITYVAPLLFLDLVMIKKFSGVSLEDKLRSGNYNIESLSNHSGHFMLPSLHNFTLSSPLQTTRALPREAPSSRRLALELVCSLIIYDALFFLFHLSLHTVPGLKNWHIMHHTHQEVHPQVTNQLSVFERLGLVLLANFSLNIIGSHVLTRTIFVPVFVWLLIEIHSGLDTWWSYDKILPSGWGGGARKHKLHHEIGFSGGVEPFFCWCDDMYQSMFGGHSKRADP